MPRTHPAAASAAATAAPGRARRAGTVAAASLGLSVVQLDVFVVNVGVRTIGAQLHGGTAALQWVVSAYTLLFAALILTGGALGDRFGAKRVFSAGFGLFIAASVACALAPSMGALIAARAVQGAGAAVLVGCSLALISHAFPDEAGRGRAIAVWAAGAAAALSLGPVLGGLLIAAFGWRSIFLINVPLGAAGLLLTWRYTSETPPSGRRLDLAGQVSAGLSLGGLAYALIQGGADGFTSPAVLAGFALAVVSGAAFCAAESRTRQPMLPLGLFRRPLFAAPAFLGLLVNVAFYGLIFVFSLLWQQQDGYSPLRAGLAFLPLSAAVLVTNLASGPLAAKIGARAVIWLGLAAMAAGCAGLLGAGPGTPFADLVGQTVLLSAGVGLLVPPMTAAVMGSVDTSRAGVASGTLNAMRQAGSVLGVAIFGVLVAGPGRFGPGLHAALTASVALAAVAAVLTVAIRPPAAAGG
jgi:DHA2 family methylenomycin A resistance protein-like MFS transporter